MKVPCSYGALFLKKKQTLILMKHIIIFGGAGFIGTNLTKKLLEDGHKVLCVDSFITGRVSNLEQFKDNKNFKFHIGDIVNVILWTQIIYDWIYEFFGEDSKVDEIYNLACPASPQKYLAHPLLTLRTSVAVQNICIFAKHVNAKLLHASTSEIYGDPDDQHHPQNEEYHGNVNTIGPRSCYDEGKRLAETIMYEYKKLGTKCKIVRIFNTYGPYMDPKDGRVVSNFICQALKNENITIYGDGTQTRSFQYIDDLVRGLIQMMETDDDYFGPVNIGNPVEFTINELAQIVKELIPESTSSIIYEELPKDDPLQRKANISRAYHMFGYDPKIQLREGLIKTIEYFRNEISK